MWQTDTEQSEALEQMGAKRSDVLVNFKKPMSHLSHVPSAMFLNEEEEIYIF